MHRLVASIGVLGAASLMSSADAADRFWTGLGDGISFSDRLNWSPANVPGAADRAIFDTIGGAIVLPGGVVTNQGITVGGPLVDVEFDLATGTYQLISPSAMGSTRSLLIGVANGDLASFGVSNGVLFGNSGAIGVEFGSIGALNLAGGMVVSFSGPLNVGEAGIGELTLAGQLITGPSVIGDAITGFGSVVVDRAAGVWLIFGDFVLGNEGNADVSAINSATIIASSQLRVGSQLGSSGVLLVSDPGTFVLASEGAILSGDEMGPGGSAIVSVENGSLMRVDGSFLINSEGDLTIFNARVEASDLIIDGGSVDLQADGTLLVSEGGTRLQPGVFIGLAGQPGLLTIRNGGTLDAGPGFFGDEPDAGGTVLLEGPGSSAVFLGDLLIGNVPTETGALGEPMSVILADEATISTDGLLALRQRGMLIFEGGTIDAGSAELSDHGLVTIELVPGAKPPPAIVSTGAATVGGGVVATTPGAAPTINTIVEILRAPTIDGLPAVAGSPLLPVFRYLTIENVPVAGAQALRARVVYLPVYLRLGPGTTSPLMRAPTAVAVAPFTGELAPDALVTQPALVEKDPGQVQLLVSEVISPGNAPTFVVAATVEVGVDPIAIAQGDLDGDGKPDAVVSNRGDGTLSVLRNTSAVVGGGIELDLTLVIGGEPGGVAIADLNGNLFNDIAAVQSADDLLFVFFNDGTGRFGDPLELTTGSAPQTVCPIDLGGDRDSDLVVVNFGIKSARNPAEAPSVGVHVNDGGGSFAPPVYYAVGAGPIGMGAGDLDVDGNIDVVTANSVAGSISVLVGLPDGTFLPAVDLDAGGFPTAIAVGDFDNDAAGDLDVAVIVEDEMGVPSLTLFRNDSSGGVLVLTTILNAQTVFGIPTALASANADLDGPEDLVTVGGDPDGSVVGGGGFISVYVAAPVSCPGDIDGNGFVSGDDLGGLLGAWEALGDSPYDLNDDGIVNSEDLAILIADWGDCLSEENRGRRFFRR